MRRASIHAALAVFVLSAAALTIAGPPTKPPFLGQPQPLIVGPTTANPGDLVILDATQSQDAVGFAWLLVDSDKTFLPVEDGKKVVFSTGLPGRYTFVLVAANATSTGTPQVAIKKHVLTVGTPLPPGPDPGPGPTPPPTPLPPGRYGLASYVFDSATRLVALTGTEKQRTATALAGSFDGIASAIAAGAIKSLDEGLKQTVASNNNALGASAAAWQAWGLDFTAKMKTLDDAGQVKVVADMADAWREAATGLRAVK